MYSPKPSPQPDGEPEWPRPAATTQRIPPPPPTYLSQPTTRPPSGTAQTQALRRWLRIPTERPVVTRALLVILVIIYIPAIFAPDVYNWMLTWGANEKSFIYEGQWWRLVTSTFLHAPWPLIIHIGLNGYALYVIGAELEAFVGRLRFVAIYVVSGLAGSVASFAFIPAHVPGMGASGAIFGLIGALGVYFGLHRRLFGKMGTAQFWNIIVVIALNMGIGFLGVQFFGRFTIDNSAHIGGLIAGAAIGYVLCPRYKLGDWYNPLVRNVVNINKGPLTWIAATLIGLIVVAAFLDLWLLFRAGILVLGVG